MGSMSANEIQWVTGLHGKLMKLLAETHWWRENDAKREGGDEYASGYDVQLTLTFTMRPIYPVKSGKVDPDETGLRGWVTG